MNRINAGIAISAALLSAAVGCGGDDTGPLADVESLVILQREARGGMGDIFQYSSYIPGAKLIKLSPPTADGTQTVICCDAQAATDPALAGIDISGYDISFDAREIVFSGSTGGNYGLYVLELETGTVEQLPTDMNRHAVSPIYLPGDKIMFTTTAVVEAGAPQHVDEYERGTTMQLGVINRDGTGYQLFARNLSHRVFPTLLSDGRVMATQWDHLGDMNSGHLMHFNPDGGGMREGFGKEGTGVSNSYLKAVEIEPGRVVAIATSRDRTVQAGAIAEIRLGKANMDGEARLGYNLEQSEANATYVIHTPQVPLGREPSFNGVGRYYDAYPLNRREFPDLLVSWADGPVESGTLSAANTTADFGVYLYDTQKQTRLPILNSPKWDIFPKALRPRTAPPVIAPVGSNGFSDQATLIGSMDVFRSSINADLANQRSNAWAVRIMEGFSSEECDMPMDFGTSMAEGHALLGQARIQTDGSWAALVPANIPIHLQVVDKFNVSIQNEPVWFSGNAGESRFCGGCHESRTDTTVIQPGLTQAVAQGPLDAMSSIPRRARNNIATPPAAGTHVGVPWDQTVQPILTAKCAGCHNGTPNAMNPSYTLMDEMGNTFVWTFDLSGGPVDVQLGEFALSGYSKSYISLVGFEMRDLEEAGITIVGGTPKVYLEKFDAAGSEAIELLNPMLQFPTPDTNVRRYPTVPHAQAAGFADLTPAEFNTLILAADMGSLWYSRENGPNPECRTP